MDMGIAGRWALVGGASKGLGFGCAAALAMEGVNVVMVSRGREVLEASAIKIRALCADSMPANSLKGTKNVPEILTVAADITTSEGRTAIFALRKDFDIVVTNAGGPPAGDFRTWERDTWLAALDANMLTPIELIKATVDGMAARGFGRIVNITSSAVKSPIDILGLSNGARSGLTGFVAGVARSSLAAKGVTINNLLPGIFDTDRLASNFATQAAKAGKPVEEVKAARIAALPGKRLGNAEEFGKTCAFLCSQHAGYINGQNILIDGGSFPGTF
ncbi:MAG: SDR family oxidoreductase [Burkholderiales bacterium]|nr:MAG: SDR family oxidoreductase [Burkholderiales bacterium]